MSYSLKEIEQDQAAMAVILNLSAAFEGIAGLKIANIKNQVLSAQEFFSELWQIYHQVRVDNLFRFGRSQQEGPVINKELFIAFTGEGGLSGDIDERLIDLMLKNYHPESNDIIVVGHHGALQLVQKAIKFKRYFKLPERDQNINVMPIVKEVQKYRTSTAYYQTYVSLMTQDIRQLELSKAVAEQATKIKPGEEVISEQTYIFEPSTFAVVDHLERSMLQIMLGQIILESKLAQYASRFRAMSAAHDRADDTLSDLRLIYQRTHRAQKDERLKEIMNGLRKVGKGGRQ